MTKENFIIEVSKYSLKIATTDLSLLILNGKRYYNLKKNEGEYIVNVMNEVSKKVVPGIIDSIKPSTDFSDTDLVLVRAFMFYFDKCVEMVYNIRVDNDKQVTFNFEELFNGISGNQIPEYIQIKITKIVATILTIYKKTFYYAQSFDIEGIDLENKIKSILYSAIAIGTQYALEIDLEDDTEFQKFLKS